MIGQIPMKKRVLIVDDDPAIRESVGKVLKGAGYEVSTAADGEAAAVQFVPEQIDLVLLDLNLQSQSGWDVFERMTTQHPSVPIIIITGMPNQYQTALGAGVGALMEKPIEVPALLKTMEVLLAEPKETRLRRMLGYTTDTRYWQRPNAGATGTSPRPLMKPRRRPRAHGGPRWTEK